MYQQINYLLYTYVKRFFEQQFSKLTALKYQRIRSVSSTPFCGSPIRKKTSFELGYNELQRSVRYNRERLYFKLMIWDREVDFNLL
jgi:hypothetical protein